MVMYVSIPQRKPHSARNCINEYMFLDIHRVHFAKLYIILRAPTAGGDRRQHHPGTGAAHDAGRLRGAPPYKKHHCINFLIARPMHDCHDVVTSDQANHLPLPFILIFYPCFVVLGCVQVRKEAVWAISNATSGGSPDQIEFLVSSAQSIALTHCVR